VQDLGNSTDVSIDPDAFKTIQELVYQQGLTFESYMVTTADGYHLAVYRIYDKSPTGKPPVFM
jgi:hypothetical protein